MRASCRNGSWSPEFTARFYVFCPRDPRRCRSGSRDYIAAHYGEEDLSTAQIAEHFHFSPAYMNVLFKQEMKMTLKQYLSNYRLERARKLLEQGYMKVTEIADKCGYANEESARRDLRGYCVWEKSGNGSEMLL